MPIERLRMRPWLENALNEHKFPGVEWVSEEDKIFRLPWKHASRNGWQINTDASLFRAWAVHTGKYKSNEKPNPKTWKANFRCALNSLPDMEELTDRRTTKGNNAFKVYRIMNSTVKKGYTSKKMKGRAQRKKRQLYRARSIQKQFQPKNNNNTESAQSCESNCMEDDTTTSFPQEMNGTHLVDHDYAVTRYFDIFNETTDDNMQEVFDDSDSKRVKTEPLSPQEIRVDDDYSLYDESAVDTKNIKTSCTKEDDKIMSDDEVVELIDELSSDNGSCTSVDAAMDELLVDIDPFENCFSSEKSKQRATSAPGMLQPSLDIFCPQPSKALRSKSSSDIQTMSSLTHEEFLLQVVSGKFEG